MQPLGPLVNSLIFHAQFTLFQRARYFSRLVCTSSDNPLGAEPPETSRRRGGSQNKSS